MVNYSAEELFELLNEQDECAWIEAKEAYHNAGQKITDHFPDLGKMVEADIKAIENETDGLLNLILGE